MSNVCLSKVNELSAEEVGYLEKKTADKKYLYDKTKNAGNNNFTKYAQDIHDKLPDLLNGNKQGKAYCAVYQLWLICVASGWDLAKVRKVMCLDGSVDKGQAAAGAENMRNYFVYHKRYDKSPKVGDIIFFDTDSDKEAEHVGRVTKITASKIYTTEGNTTKDGKGGVYDKSYALSNKKIMGYGHPYFDDEPAPKPTPDPKPEKKVIKATQPAKKGPDKSKAKTYTVKKNNTAMKYAASVNAKDMVKLPAKAQVKCYGYYTPALLYNWLYVVYEKDNVTYEGYISSKGVS